MESAPKWPMLLLLTALVSFLVNVSTVRSDFQHCQSVVKNWASSAFNEEVKEDRHTLRDLLFFLHIPRTGGRTYFHCFLKKLYSSHHECPRSYDKLRFDPRQPNCRLLTTHDDYSMMSKLPNGKTSVVTILRNPVDRVFSTYEFSIEVAARFLVHKNLTSATQMTRRLRKKTNGISTLDIWPWKYLVPWMREDLFSRREARMHKAPNYDRRNDSYNMKDLAMPLRQYINDPIAMDIVHNGATFQVAGLTNNSYLEESHEVRHCVQKYLSLGEHVLNVAKKRLDNMLYIGLTEDHKGSATMFAHMVGAQVLSQLGAANSGAEHAAKNGSEQSSSFVEFEPETAHEQSGPTDHKTSETALPEIEERRSKKMTVGELMEAYEDCITSLRKTQSQRRSTSLKRIAPVNFTKVARHHVPESTLQQIVSLNSLDVELYKYAQSIFAVQHERLMQKLEREDNILIKSFGPPLWKVISLSMAFVSLLLLCFFVNTRRRTTKVKL